PISRDMQFAGGVGCSALPHILIASECRLVSANIVSAVIPERRRRGWRDVAWRRRIGARHRGRHWNGARRFHIFRQAGGARSGQWRRSVWKLDVRIEARGPHLLAWVKERYWKRHGYSLLVLSCLRQIARDPFEPLARGLAVDEPRRFAW